MQVMVVLLVHMLPVLLRVPAQVLQPLNLLLLLLLLLLLPLLLHGPQARGAASPGASQTLRLLWVQLLLPHLQAHSWLCTCSSCNSIYSCAACCSAAAASASSAAPLTGRCIIVSSGSNGRNKG
jgi:hypothetical protein